MSREYNIEIEQETIEFDPFELEQWQLRNSDIVPDYALKWKGPGLSNGYGYGEFFTKRHLEKDNEEVISNDFNMLSQKSKYHLNNERIEEAMGKSNYKRLHNVFLRLYQQGVKVENPDLCILKPKLYFAEVKKGKDYLREPQIVFAVVLQELFKIPFKVYKLEPINKEYNKVSILKKSVSLPENFED